MAVVAAFAVAGFLVNFDVVTGQYYASGGGRYYYGPQKALLQPDEACTYAGFQPLDPWRVESNEYGNLMSVCRDGGQYVMVPLLQTVLVP